MTDRDAFLSDRITKKRSEGRPFGRPSLSSMAHRRAIRAPDSALDHFVRITVNLNELFGAPPPDAKVRSASFPVATLNR